MRGVRPSLKQKRILREAGYDETDYLFIRKSASNLKFISKSTGQILDLRI